MHKKERCMRQKEHTLIFYPDLSPKMWTFLKQRSKNRAIKIRKEKWQSKNKEGKERFQSKSIQG